MPRLSLVAAGVGLAASIAGSGHASTVGTSPMAVNAADAAIERLQDALLHRDGGALDCLALLHEDDAGNGWSFALHEIHDAGCGGDPGTSPLRGRYRVSAKGGISAYDPAEDACTALPLTRYRRSGQSTSSRRIAAP
ncbi:MAG TPA: hypothetical protein VIG88_08595 [Lysobacter sp.]